MTPVSQVIQFEVNCAGSVVMEKDSLNSILYIRLIPSREQSDRYLAKPESAAIDNFVESKITTIGSGSIVPQARFKKAVARVP